MDASRTWTSKASRGVWGACASVVIAWTSGCGDVFPLRITNESTVPVATQLLSFPENERADYDWATLRSRLEPLDPGETRSFKREARGAAYLLAISGPGLEGTHGYEIYAVPAAPIHVLIRGNQERVNAWLDGQTPVLMRP